MSHVAPLVGILVFFGIAIAFSTNRRAIPWRLVAAGTGLQVFLALFIVRPDWVPAIVTVLAAGCVAVLGFEAFRRSAPPLVAGAACGLGLLGLVVPLVWLAFRARAWWALLLVPLPLVAAHRAGGGARRALAVAGCGAIVGALLLLDFPHDFVFRGLQGAGAGVTWLIGFAQAAADRVFGTLRTQGGYVFAIEVGSIILLFGGLMSVLYHVGVIPWVVGLLARVLHRALGVSGAESLAAASNVFVGQTEAPLIVRPYLAAMTRSEVTALMTGGFATIAGSVLGAYVGMLGGAGFEQGAAHLIAASVMSAPAAFVFAKLFVPETEQPLTRDALHVRAEPLGVNLLDALAGGVTAALKLAVNVVAMLLVFYALIFILDAVVAWVATELFDRPAVTFPELYAEVFRPFAWLIGVPGEDTRAVGELLGTKTIFNEFVAYERLAGMIREGEIGARAAVLATYALCGFANFMSIGIQIGGLSQLAPGRRADFSRLALRAMVAGAFACQMTACVVALLG